MGILALKCTSTHGFHQKFKSLLRAIDLTLLMYVEEHDHCRISGDWVRINASQGIKIQIHFDTFQVNSRVFLRQCMTSLTILRNTCPWSLLGFYTMKCVRALLLTELQVKMRVCKHGCEVSLFVRNISKLSQHAKKIQDKMLRQSKELCLLR